MHHYLIQFSSSEFFFQFSVLVSVVVILLVYSIGAVD